MLEFLTITLLIFSGRPNPECTIQSGDADFRRVKDMLPPPPGANIPGGLGYQGYVVMDTTGAGVTSINIPKHSDEVLERLLFDVCNFDPNLKKYIFIN